MRNMSTAEVIEQGVAVNPKMNNRKVLSSCAFAHKSGIGTIRPNITSTYMR